MTTLEILLFASGGLACAITSFLVGSFFKRPAEIKRRIEYAAISGAGAVAICWLGCKYFPDRFEAWDSVPYSILIGLFGIGRVLDWIAKRYGLEPNAEGIRDEQEK